MAQMNLCEKSSRSVPTLTLTLIALGGSAICGNAIAGCAPPPAAIPGSHQIDPSPLDGFASTVWRSGADSQAALLRVNDTEDWRGEYHFLSIVGMWKFSFVSEGSPGIPDGSPVDAGYVTWHADFTELLNSGRAPMTGSFCMGVWKPLGHDTYQLNHIAMSWDTTGTVYVGPANIRETVTVNRRGDGYSGKFTLDQYATDEKTLLAHVQGKVTATRITVD
jgi:hypothetical protein